MTNCKKMLALSEVGTIPDIDTCHGRDINWLYFMSWGDLVSTDNSVDHLNIVYGSSNVTSVEDLTTMSDLIV